MGAPLVVGVDSSTQSVKVEARRLDTGDVVAVGSARHPATTPPVSEQDPNAWWTALVEACAALGECRRDVVAIAVAGQQHGLVLLDEGGVPLRPAKLWNDTTSAPQAERLVTALGAERWAARIGSVPVASFTITKLAWVAEHEPDVIARTARVMLPHDHLTWRLTGEHVTDRGDASGSGWFDAATGTVDLELLAMATGADWSGRVPTVLDATVAAGTLAEGAAVELGLPSGIVVGPGTGDNMGAALGLGLRAGDVAISLGTSGTAFAVSATPTRDASGAVAGFASASGEFLPLVCTLNATKVTDTVARWLGTDAAGLARLALDAAPSPGDVVLVPYFDGERTPNLPDATGTFVGLTNVTTREQLALAAHDGVLCGLLDGVDALRSAGASVNGRIFLVGGGARSEAYRRRLAELAGRPVTVPDTDETVATGAAVQAAVVTGSGSFEAVAQRWACGRGTDVEPLVDATERRAAYAAARVSRRP
ncbi:MAG: xylulokinase [Ilumatobacteraceae bacterium]